MNFFDKIENFDIHILQSIPNYDLLFDSIVRMSEYFIDSDLAVYDIGCSTGRLLKAVQEKHKVKNEFIGIDRCDNLLPQDDEADISFIKHDLNDGYNFKDSCIAYSIFTLQFIERRNRMAVLEAIYKSLKKGGALIIAEKVFAEHSINQDIFTFCYYDYKKLSFTPKEIFDKEESLRTILKPNTSEENHGMLKGVGFEKVEMFYKYFNFEAFLCVK